MGMRPGSSLALKAKVVCLDENDKVEVCPHNMAPDVLEKAYNDHVALSTTTFWRDPTKAKAYNDLKMNPSGKKKFASKTRPATTFMTRTTSSRTFLMRTESNMVEGLFLKIMQSSFRRSQSSGRSHS